MQTEALTLSTKADAVEQRFNLQADVFAPHG